MVIMRVARAGRLQIGAERPVVPRFGICRLADERVDVAQGLEELATRRARHDLLIKRDGFCKLALSRPQLSEVFQNKEAFRPELARRIVLGLSPVEVARPEIEFPQ